MNLPRAYAAKLLFGYVDELTPAALVDSHPLGEELAPHRDKIIAEFRLFQEAVRCMLRGEYLAAESADPDI